MIAKTRHHEIPTSPADNTQTINSGVMVWTPEEFLIMFVPDEFASPMPTVF